MKRLKQAMKTWIFSLMLAGLLGPHVRGADFTVETTRSPDGRFMIAGDGSIKAPKRIYFENVGSGVSAGSVMQPDQAGATNVQIAARWNDSSSRVALLISFGTKGSDFKLFEEEGGKFVQVGFEEPDPLLLLQMQKPGVIPALARPTASTDCLGLWMNNITVRLLHGTDVVFSGKDQQPEISTVYASFEVVVERRAEVKNVRLFGPYSEAESTSFLERWAKGN